MIIFLALLFAFSSCDSDLRRAKRYYRQAQEVAASDPDSALILTDSKGMEVYTQNVHGERGQNIIDLQKLPVGVYILTIKCEEHRLTEKVVLTR